MCDYWKSSEAEVRTEAGGIDGGHCKPRVARGACGNERSRQRARRTLVRTTCNTRYTPPPSPPPPPY